MKPIYPMRILEPIEQSVCNVFGVTQEQLRAKRGPRHVVEARFAYIAKAFETRRFSMNGLGGVLGYDHSQIKSAIVRAKELRSIDPMYDQLYLRVSCE